MIRAVLSLLMFLFAIFLPFWLLVPIAIAYAIRFWAFELIIFAALIDAYFGAVVDWPYYTIGALAIVVLAELAKEHLNILNTTNV